MSIESIISKFGTPEVPDFGPKKSAGLCEYFKYLLRGTIPTDELIVELGVFRMNTLGMININTGTHIVHGFDTFTGLPEDWKFGEGHIIYKQGCFSLDGYIPNNTDKNKFIVGKVEDTLASFLIQENKKIRFIHLDLDLYSATKTGLECIVNYIQKGTVIAIDDAYKLPGWEEHSIKALSEFIDTNNIRYESVASVGIVDGWANIAIRVL